MFHPVVMVTWYEAVAFCRWLQERLQITDYRLQVWREGELETLSLEPKTLHVRLPSETEWENFCQVIGKPELLLADEPTGNVDPNMANRLLRLFIELNRLGTSVIIATHDFQLMEQCDAPRMVLNEGHLEVR